jgi:hypothetical protein
MFFFFLDFPWYTEQQSLQLHLIVTALQLTFIVNHHFSNKNTGLQQETSAQHCDCFHMWQLHSKILLFLNACIMLSIAWRAIAEFAFVFGREAQNLRAISESGNIVLNKREVQYALWQLPMIYGTKRKRTFCH